MPTSRRAKKRDTYFLQARLHEDVEDEKDHIETCEYLKGQGYSDREIARMALRELRKAMDSGYVPQASITPAVVDAEMLKLWQQVNNMMGAMTELADNLNNGSWSTEQAANEINQAVKKFGIPMQSAVHASSIIDINVEDDW